MLPGEFPNDENGNALRVMEESGDDLSKSRTINFSILFDSLDGAHRFVTVARKLKLDAFIEDDSPNADSTDVTVKRDMVPTHKDIGDFEATLKRIAHPLGGENDGWGCFSA